LRLCVCVCVSACTQQEWECCTEVLIRTNCACIKELVGYIETAAEGIFMRCLGEWFQRYPGTLIAQDYYDNIIKKAKHVLYVHINMHTLSQKRL
jgi:hypothetical protein